MKIDQVDVHILNELSKDSRQSMRELAKKVNLSAPSVTERVRRMESFGMIKHYSTQFDYKKIGFPVSCLIEATIKNGEYERFKAHIKTLPYVEFCYRIAGEACYMLKINRESLEQVETFINETAPYAQTVTHVIFSEVETMREIIIEDN
ncbi:MULTISPECIES: Lrp/AsnC family transcriptional regulator [Bacillus]|uniref:AsnC family transcriptional regulator n=2 Tax=Bacillus TaxID=1386 RepID=A0A0M4FU98_9BACI|nr:MULTISPECIES: Lrp/AsnC family transcriptional regulator [Bacillus]ALC83773.1 AsnC family transcriptional regulator [Bacillus gobiensis]MBP1083996.1 Lrp/AsnC family leucine-responsive transcriptional regulator [Bacillus capparidis]MED1096958.1 Lrp/AsnC family transcriptional regulator [Bacillus capparidis]